MKENKYVRLRKVFGIFITFLLINSVGLSFASAEDAKISIGIPVSQIFSVSNIESSKVSDEFSYLLTANNQESPMPIGSGTDGYSFTLSGNTNITIPNIEYIHAGIYRYTLRQIVNSEIDGYNYDCTVYNIEVHVRNNGEELSSDLVVYNGPSKVESIEFNNSYTEPISDQPTTPSGDSIPVQTGENSCVPILIIILIVSLSIFSLLKRKSIK